MNADPAEPLLVVRGLSKAYPGVQALADVSIDLRGGEIHALVGENGAGKSTLARILAGVSAPDRGSMSLRGAPYAPTSRTDAQRQGVAMVMQELNLIDNLTVAENLMLDRLPSWMGLIDYPRLNEIARHALADLGVHDIRPDCSIGALGVGQKQMVEIAAALSRRCSVLILDEPTAALTQRETDVLFDRLRRLRASGVAIVYISHRMEEIMRLADRISVLRDGRLIGTQAARDLSIERIIRMMVGRALPRSARGRRPIGPLALRVEGLCAGSLVRDVSFELRRGQILGFAGLMGSGRTETMRAIFGADRPRAGHVYLHGSTLPARIRSPKDAVRLGIGMLTEDRKQQGLFLPLGLTPNVTMARMEAVAVAGWIAPSIERAAAGRQVAALDVRCRSLDQPVVELSGGNQQKVVVARWMFRDCDILIFDEPTRGIDVGAKFEIYQVLERLAASGKAIIVVSSDLPELMAICDRIAVMSAGRLVEILEPDGWSQDRIMAAALSGYASDDKPQTTVRR